MKRFAVPLLVLLLLLLACPALFADILQYRSRNWQTDNGLPHNSVSTVLCSREGHIWLGTPRGAARFEGSRFTVFNPQNTPSMTEPAVRALAQTKDGTVWIAGENGSLVCLRDGQFARSSLAAGRQVRTIYETRDGALWIGTMNGLARWKEGRCVWFSTADGMAGNSVLALCEDHAGNLWVGTTRGLSVYRDKFIQSYDEQRGMSANSVRTLLCDQENTVWVGTSGGGLLRFKNGQIQRFTKANGLPDLFISALLEDQSGQLWVGTMGGLCRRFGDVFVAQSNGEATSYETVFCLAEDHERGLWLGTKEGLNQLVAKPFRSYTKEQGLAHNNVMSVREDSQGTIWIATWGGGLCGLSNGRITTYNRSNSLLYDILLSLCEARDGSLWIGSDFDGGLYRFQHEEITHYGRELGLIDPAIRVIHEDRRGNLWLGTSGALYLFANGKFHRFTTANGLAGNVIRALCEDHNGDLWIGTGDGLTRVSQATQNSRSKVEVDGNIATNTPTFEFGLGTLDFQSFTTNHGLSCNAIIALHEDSDHTLWIGTDGGGLNRLKVGDQPATNREKTKIHIASYTSKQGLFSDNISEIIEDDRGFFWMGCFSGVFRLRKSDLDKLDAGAIEALYCIWYGKADGLSSIQCNNVSKPAGWKSKDGKLWFPTTRGVITVDPAAMNETVAPPPVTIEEVIADQSKIGDGQWRLARGPTLSAPSILDSPSSLRIPPGRGQLEFHYAALSFRAPEKNRFKYRLEGVDPEWIDAGFRRTAYYNNLPPGHYTFRVKGCDSSGVWNEAGASVSFVLLPHPWQTWWFKLSVAAASLCLVAAMARYVTKRRMLLSLQRLEHQHALQKERSRIAQDMHDDLGARLTQILMVNDFALKAQGGEAEIKGHVAKVAQLAQDLVRNLDAIVWAVNPQNDSLESMALYLYEYFEMYLGPSPIRYRLDVPPTLPIAPVTSEVRHNIFLVLKEALNNIVKHAEASEVWLRLRVESVQGSQSNAHGDPEGLMLMLAIEDDGRGLPDTAESAFSSGLINMKKRIDRIGGRFEIKSEKGKGTRIQFEIPIRRS